MVPVKPASLKEFCWISLGVLGILLIFFWDLFSLKVGFISGDHRVQHYPWMAYLASELKAGRFPLWTDLIGCGFPIFAEDQIAPLYPLNLFFFFLFPLNFAFNYSILAHYLLGGIFLYLFARKIALSWQGAGIAAFLYLFSSSQGGYFYNMTSQKTVIWFPLVLFLMEKFLESRRWIYLLWIGMFLGIQINAGYLQVAVYTIGFSCFYFLLRHLLDPAAGKSVSQKIQAFGVRTFGFLAVALAVGLPQLAATLELAQFSSRTNLPESFAYVGSLPPQGFLTLLFPFLDNFLGTEFYAGLFSILLILIAWFYRKTWTVPVKVIFWMGLIALLFAMGQFNPLYVAFVKLTHFYGFRVPAKVLYFAVFSMAILAGVGWDKLMRPRGEEKPAPTKAGRIFIGIMVAGFLLAFFGEALLRPLVPVLKQIGSWMLEKFYVGSPLHPQSLEEYLARLDQFLEKFIRVVSIRENFWMKLWSLFLGLNLLWGGLFLWKGEKIKKLLIPFALLLLIGDLYSYGFVSIRGNWAPYETYFNSTKPFIEYLKKESKPFRIYEYSLEVVREESFPLIYNLNMLYGLSDIGVYSPLALKSHRTFFKGLGANSDSLFVNLADPKSFPKLKPLLDLSNVKYLISYEPLPDSAWQEQFSAGGFTLYENLEVLPRAFWMPIENTVETDDFNAYARSGAFNPERQIVFEKGTFEKIGVGSVQTTRSLLEPVEFLKNEPGILKLSANFSKKGWLFVSDIDYPGWRARRNGKGVPIWRANGLFKAVLVDSGPAVIELSYEPFYKPLLWLPLVVLGIVLILSFRKSKG